jgi:hypothetical protein
MDSFMIPDAIDYGRRNFFGAAAMAVAVTQLGMIGSAEAKEPTKMPADRAATNASFGALKQIDAGVLNVGYAEDGPADGPPVTPLHGWPYDIYSYVDVAPLLAAAGHRVIVPYRRGYGTTRFLSNETLRNGQQAVIAVDAQEAPQAFAEAIADVNSS